MQHALKIFTDASKEGWGAHLIEHTARGIWSLPETKLHINYLELKTVFLALKEFRTLCSDKIVLVATDNTTVVSYINKEGGLKSGTLCALLWRILTWCTKNQVALKARHIPGWLNVVADKLARLGQTVVLPSSSVQNTMQQMAPTSNRSLCNQIQQQGPPVGVTGSRHHGHCSRCSQSIMGGAVESKSPCLAPRALAIKEQGFSKDVATRIEAAQRGSTRSVYEAKWTIFTKWCLSNKVDFRAPPVKSIADFLLYLFQDRNLQPSTIDGYRSAIADKL